MAVRFVTHRRQSYLSAGGDMDSPSARLLSCRLAALPASATAAAVFAAAVSRTILAGGSTMRWLVVTRLRALGRLSLPAVGGGGRLRRAAAATAAAGVRALE